MIEIEIIDNFEDPALGPEVWNGLLAQSSRPVVFMTWEWQRAWWDAFGRGRLLIVTARRHGAAVAILPLFADSGMLYFVGSGGSDYLDVIAAADECTSELISAMLSAAAGCVETFLGCVLYHLPDWSPMPVAVRSGAPAAGLRAFDEWQLPAPTLEIAAHPEEAEAATQKKKLLQFERVLHRDGQLTIEHASHSADIAPHLDTLFQQHKDRWARTTSPSLFHDPQQRSFYHHLVRRMSDTGWLRFTVVRWNDQPLAFHFGMSYAGRFIYYKPTFDIRLARRSPGVVLFRQVLLRAIAEGATEFDMGLGDEAFKERFATHVHTVTTIGLYP